MLRNLQDIEGFSISAVDGVIGSVKDFYFDDDIWVVRYAVVETGTWHRNRRVLISPVMLGQPAWQQRLLPASITQAQVRNSPDIDTDKPVSRQQEMGYAGYYGYGNYWGGGGLWGAGFYPDILQAGAAANESRNEPRSPRTRIGKLDTEASAARRRNDLHLRSANNVKHYYVHASDGDIGHVQGFLVEDETWAIRYLIVNTSNWWLGHDVLIAPEWIEDLYWEESKVMVGLSRETLKGAPAYDSKVPFSRDQERILYAYYGHAAYWQ